MIRKWRLPCDVYGSDLWLVIGSAQEINAFTRRRYSIDDDIITDTHRASFDHFSSDDLRVPAVQQIAIAKDRNLTRFDLAATLAHEVAHFVFHMLEKCDVTVSAEHDEAFAYYFEHTYRLCLKRIWA